jgi:hypothetical protein
MTSKNKGDDQMVDDFFAAARVAAPEPSAALLARVLEDAQAVQAAARPPVPRPAKSEGFLAQVGGWFGLGGMAAATLAGVWVGFAGVGGLSTAVADVWGGTTTATTVDLIPGEDFIALALGTEG